MKKEGIVLKLDGAYLEVWEKESLPCHTERECISDDIKVHDCSTCSLCSPLNFTKLKTVRVWNKTGKDIKVGDKINYSLNSIVLQFFIIIVLPFLIFVMTFAFLYCNSYKEELCILFSFLASFLIIGLNIFFTKKLLKKVFQPFV